MTKDTFEFSSKASMATEHPPTPESMDMGFIEAGVDNGPAFWNVTNEELGDANPIVDVDPAHHTPTQEAFFNAAAGFAPISTTNASTTHNNFNNQHHFAPTAAGFSPMSFGQIFNPSAASLQVTGYEDPANNWLAGLELNADFPGPLDTDWGHLALGTESNTANGGASQGPASRRRKSSVLFASQLLMPNFLPRAAQLPSANLSEGLPSANISATAPSARRNSTVPAKTKSRKASASLSRPASTSLTAPETKKLKRMHKATRKATPSPRSVAPSPTSKAAKKASQRSREQSSQYRGVSRCSKDGRFQSRIRVGPKVIYLGRFKDELSAARAYDKAAIQYHEKRACLNFPNEAPSGFTAVAV
ncbi:AP2-like ethylene-responsive transcription factor PLT2 [Hondaea fermentalgiana]|uniref:AP2-like ethylene-responsive transcription factor PLT2 n=1 Tax=Hondaea fermentalgiana TaxID=2315210 RepID=A0A2R5GSH2_9STRA|nr:AP2-like ethylene-responsive transcription factor PLT2 [Hondaea fermentalgiana]|eukprot:GBG33259.1 AP2-like ethylene-responsive transcription factor PLT2 [Hondaea fermentalgiana]